jgi:histidyl-tRNA synthetase
MSKQLNAPRGTYDALPEQSRRFNFIEQTARKTFETYGYGEIRTPIFEHAEVFLRTVGDTTDIVSKEMYVFPDRNDEKMALRPEGTAPVARAYYSNGLKQHLPLRLAYYGSPMFRYERPQKGRYRQFHQVGIEFFGIQGPLADVEVIAAAIDLLKNIGLKQELVVHLNSLGTKEDRAIYREKLIAYFEPVKNKLSKESQQRLTKNPMRILDSKEQEDAPFIKDAPMPLDHLSTDSQAHFEAVKEGLAKLDIAYEVNPAIVRGLDYYTHTVFEIHGVGLGAQSQIVGGGRYDGLLEQLGNDAVPAVGFGCGIERLESIMPSLAEQGIDVTCVAGSDQALTHVILPLAHTLRLENISVHTPMETPVPSFKSQFKKLNKYNPKFAVIVGDDELQKGMAEVKDLASCEQSSVKITEIASHLKRCGLGTE